MEPVPEFLIEKYESVELVGKGADGTVYKCVHNQTTTATKLLHTLDETSRARFEREVKIIKGIDHPNVVKVLDAGETAGIHWVRVGVRGRIAFWDNVSILVSF